MNLINWPPPETPSTSWNTPARTTSTAKAVGRLLGATPAAATDASAPIRKMTTGPFGALIMPLVWPPIPETSEIAASPISPANAPLEESSPIAANNAIPNPMACGSATASPASPPTRSPTHGRGSIRTCAGAASGAAACSSTVSSGAASTTASSGGGTVPPSMGSGFLVSVDIV